MSGGTGGSAGLPLAVLRVCLDINIWNIWVSFLMGLQARRTGTVPARLVDMVRIHRAGAAPLQLSMSLEMLGALERVLENQGIPPALARSFPESLVALMRTGPLGLVPAAPVTGRDQLAMKDREDAGVLASCIIDRVDLLATDNLADFVTNDSDRRDTRVVVRRNGSRRQLFAVLHERGDGVALAVAHPIDALDWLESGFRPTPDAVRARYP